MFELTCRYRASFAEIRQNFGPMRDKNQHHRGAEYPLEQALRVMKR